MSKNSTPKYKLGDLVTTACNPHTEQRVTFITIGYSGIYYKISGTRGTYSEQEIFPYVEPEPEIIEPVHDYGT